MDPLADIIPAVTWVSDQVRKTALNASTIKAVAQLEACNESDHILIKMVAMVAGGSLSADIHGCDVICAQQTRSLPTTLPRVIRCDSVQFPHFHSRIPPEFPGEQGLAWDVVVLDVGMRRASR